MKRFSWLFVGLLAIWGLSFSQAQSLPSVQCGDIVEGEIMPAQTEGERAFNEYRLQIQAGTIIDLIVTPLGQSFNPSFKMLDSGGTEFAVFNNVAAGVPEEILEYSVGSSNPVLRIYGMHPEWAGTDWFYNTGDGAAGLFLGAYEISLACTLRDDTRIDFGERVEVTGDEGLPPAPVFSGFGFPGVLPVDFSAGIEIPLQLGQTQTVPIGGDVALYTYEATAGSTATLTVSRVSGNISIGVTVINRSTNEIIFVAGLPSTNSLSAEIVFPTDGSYVIGLFRFDTPTLTGSSGAVQVLLQ
jgi:hypothetical protein